MAITINDLCFPSWRYEVTIIEKKHWIVFQHLSAISNIQIPLLAKF